MNEKQTTETKHNEDQMMNTFPPSMVFVRYITKCSINQLFCGDYYAVVVI